MKKAGTKFLLELCVAALLLCGATHRFFAQESPPDLADLEKAIVAEIAATQTPGAAFAVIKVIKSFMQRVSA